MRDNARPHTARATIEALETLKFEVLSHLPIGAKQFPFLSSPQEGSQGDSFHLR